MDELIEQLKIKFKNRHLLETALTHRSYLNEHRGEHLEHNERLEFLGDAVLELIVTEFLFGHFVDKPEGELTNLRAALVKGENLTKVGQEIQLNRYLRLSRGEAKSQDRSRGYIIANAVEAIIGALYLDQGYEACRQFVEQYILKELPEIIENELYKDPKSLFQEKAQEEVGVTPVYKLIKEDGPDHEKHFEVGAYIGKNLVAKGTGKSKQEAQQQAASAFLKDEDWSELK